MAVDNRPSSGRYISERSIVYVIIAFTLGFALPVCSCAGVSLALVSRIGQLGSQTATLPIATGPAVAVIRLEGTIISQSDPYGDYITPQHVSALLEEAENDPLIRAIVLRIESPGGDVVASDEIYNLLLESDLPIVVSMGSLAASGGYYIACGTDHLIAHPDTLTGSIGVISQFTNVEELMDWIGIEVTTVTAGEVKDIGSPYREMTEEELAIWEAIITEVYDGFVSIVAQNRNLTLEQAYELADGRIYTGRQALEAGLVDQLGTLEDAITKAAELGNIPGEPDVIYLETPPTLYDFITGVQSRPSLLSIEEMIELGLMPSLEYRYVGP